MDSLERTCLDCGEQKPFTAFTPIRGTSKVYGRCKACRARQAREKKAGGQIGVPSGEVVGSGSAPKVETATAARSSTSGGRRPVPMRHGVADERTCTECGQAKPLSGFV
jgi:hypothetical protein